MVRVRSAFALLSAALFLVGCTDIWGAHMRTVHRVDKISDDSIIFTDAKQNATFARYDGVRLRACAARSPDVFSVLSAAAQGSFSFEEAQQLSAAASGQGATGESGSAFGLRTQLTQTQLELLYRLCEAQLNGSLEAADYEKQMRRFQNTMVAMLAIEQLTGYARPTIAQNTSNAGFAPPPNAAEVQKRIDALQTRKATQETAVDNALTEVVNKEGVRDQASAAAAADPTNVDKQTALANAQRDVDTAEAKHSIAQDRLFEIEQEISRLEQSLATGVAATSGDSSVTQPSEPNGATAAVATAVMDIVDNALHQTETTEECLKYVFQQSDPASTSATDERLNFCMIRLAEVNTQKWDTLYLAYGCKRAGPEEPATMVGGDQTRWSCPLRQTAPGLLTVKQGDRSPAVTAKTIDGEQSDGGGTN